MVRMIGNYNLWAARKISLANYNFYGAPVLHPDRVMEEHDLVYLQEGCWEIYQNDTPYYMESGDVILLHKGERHYGRYPCKKGTKTMYLHMSADPGDSFSQKDKEGQEGLPPLIHCRGNVEVRNLFEKIIQTFHTESYKKEEKISALLQLLLRELYASANRGEGQDNILQGVIRFIVSHPQKMWTASELAEEVHTSERTLRNRFLKEYGITPYHYQIAYKMDRIAETLIEYPETPIWAVAENFGFCDEFHLSKAFKKVYGISPTHFRKEVGTGTSFSEKSILPTIKSDRMLE